MSTIEEIEAKIDTAFPMVVYGAAEPVSPERQWLVQVFTNPPRNTLLFSAHGATPTEAKAAAAASIRSTLLSLPGRDARKKRPKYPDTPEGRLEAALDHLSEVISPFL